MIQKCLMAPKQSLPCFSRLCGRMWGNGPNIDYLRVAKHFGNYFIHRKFMDSFQDMLGTPRRETKNGFLYCHYLNMSQNPSFPPITSSLLSFSFSLQHRVLVSLFFLYLIFFVTLSLSLPLSLTISIANLSRFSNENVKVSVYNSWKWDFYIVL